MNFRLMLIPLFVGLALMTTTGYAQKLPATTRTVFKCQVGGKAVYSDTPCLGAEQINVEPTRGLSKSSGRELIGSDVRREQNREMFVEAVRPATGLDSKQFDTFGRRMKLSSESQQECRRLDSEIPITEKAVKDAKQPELGVLEERLFQLRTRFRTLGC